MRRFEREAELGGRLRHPNVVSVVDVGELPDGSRYMVMELAIGLDLGTVLQDDAPFAASRVIHVLRGLCEGLAHAHERDVIHRDFKPENIIIERDDADREVPRIVDFGIAIARDEADEPGVARAPGPPAGSCSARRTIWRPNRRPAARWITGSICSRSASSRTRW